MHILHQLIANSDQKSSLLCHHLSRMHVWKLFEKNIPKIEFVCSSRRRSGPRRRRSAVSERGVTSSQESLTSLQRHLSLTRITQPDIFENPCWWISVRRISLGPKINSVYKSDITLGSESEILSLWQKCPDITSSQWTPPPSDNQPNSDSILSPRRSQLPDQCACNMCFLKQWETTSFPHSPHFTWYHCK